MFIRQKGWKNSIEYLNTKADIYRVIKLTKFDGGHHLKEGLYYGQLLDGKRDGYGIVYCTHQCNEPYLYECEWKQGIPINQGRYIRIFQDQWWKYEGTINETYTLTGYGSELVENGYQYQGEWKQGNQHGQGKALYLDGQSYDGGWEFGSWHGEGRYTKQFGLYQTGQWNENKAVGIHKLFTKEGLLIKREDHGF
ncbi:hypothetical protein FGO68_gene10335 [Halteria grandinella]|uniref:MORN repeat protein n=1 Tax=Halteria grandinella TaxID=5974 RepID=A0A8J8NTT7_HALGN|nr:hypothetical protein FGO68_gene10335 [Halteria grandinella]